MGGVFVKGSVPQSCPKSITVYDGIKAAYCLKENVYSNDFINIELIH